MKKILIIALCFLAFTKANSQTITDVEIKSGAAYLRQTNGKIFSIIKPVTAINVEFIYLTDTTITLWGNKTSPDRTFLLNQLSSFKVEGVVKPINSFSFKVEFAAILNSSSSGGGGGSSTLPVGAATSALQQTNIDSLVKVINQLKINNDTAIIANIERRLQTTKLTEANAKLIDVEGELQGIKANQTNNNHKTKIVDASGNVISDFAKDEKLDTIISRLPNSTITLNGATKGFLVRQIQVTPFVGTNIPTVTAYNTNANTVVTTNCTEIVLENMSTTTNATFVYGGQTFTLGFKGNGVTPSFYNFKAPYNESSFKYSPFATLIVNAVGSSVFLTKYFIQ